MPGSVGMFDCYNMVHDERIIVGFCLVYFIGIAFYVRCRYL